MSDDEGYTGATAPALTSSFDPASHQAEMNRPPLPQVKPPPPLNLVDCSAKKWKRWKQTWLNYAVVSKTASQDAQYRKAVFLCTIGQGALEIYNAFQYTASEDPDKVDTIISKFEEYFTGDGNKTYERFKFIQRNQ